MSAGCAELMGFGASPSGYSCRRLTSISSIVSSSCFSGLGVRSEKRHCPLPRPNFNLFRLCSSTRSVSSSKGSYNEMNAEGAGRLFLLRKAGDDQFWVSSRVSFEFGKGNASSCTGNRGGVCDVSSRAGDTDERSKSSTIGSPGPRQTCCQSVVVG